MRSWSSLAVVMMISGCNFAPKHITPALSTPVEFPPEVSPAGSIDAASVRWEDFFQDERLRELIAQALENNRDLRIAVARIEETRGLYRIQRVDELPRLGLSAGAVRNRIGTASLSPAQGGGTGPTAEICNGLDEDCDGTNDNGLAGVVTCGTGACSAMAAACSTTATFRC